jgi:hypothetical protein
VVIKTIQRNRAFISNYFLNMQESFNQGKKAGLYAFPAKGG